MGARRQRADAEDGGSDVAAELLRPPFLTIDVQMDERPGWDGASEGQGRQTGDVVRVGQARVAGGGQIRQRRGQHRVGRRQSIEEAEPGCGIVTQPITSQVRGGSIQGSSQRRGRQAGMDLQQQGGQASDVRRGGRGAVERIGEQPQLPELGLDAINADAVQAVQPHLGLAGEISVDRGRPLRAVGGDGAGGDARCIHRADGEHLR